jgi:hypothetical protein
MIEAQAALTSAQMKLERANNFKPTPLQTETDDVQVRTSEPRAPQPPPEVVEWQSRNRWFGSDDEMTSVALVVHRQLVESGVDPRTDKYFEQLDARIRKRFPDKFEEQEEVQTSAPERKQTRSVVAPAGRSTGAKKVTLTKSQVAIAKRMGVSLEAYAKQVALLENPNG